MLSIKIVKGEESKDHLYLFNSLIKILKMSLSKQIAKHVRDIYFGNNWSATNYKKALAAVDWKMATTKINSYNTIAMLVFHTNYYIAGIMEVLKGGALEIRDKYSYNLPPIESEEDWQALKRKTFDEAEEFAQLIENMPEEKFWDIFVKEDYGNYYRNLHGVIEHLYYHFGQIVLLKKSVSTTQEQS